MEALQITDSICPKCGADRAESQTECGRCGIVFAKYRPFLPRPPRISEGRAPTGLSWRLTIHEWLFEPDQATDVGTFYGRLLVWVGLVWWGVKFIVTPLETNYTGESFLHLINLPFHEAGHLLFSPFGRFLTILGGSLGQVLMPLVCLATFLVKTRDPFGASVALWWAAESLMDVAPYINDARALELILLGGVTGKETDGHDWNNILSMLNLLEWDHRLAHLTYNVATLLMLASLAWGGRLLVRHYRRVER